MDRLRPLPSMSSDVKYQLQFILWVVLLGPVAYLAAIEKAIETTAGWALLLRYYLMAFCHFLFFAVLVSAIAIVWRRNIASWRRLAPVLRFLGISALLAVSILSAWGSLVLLGHGHGISSGILLHGTEDLMIALVIIIVERLYDSMLSSRLEAEHHLLEQETARRAAAEARWSSLESRIRPHFLFNTLTSIRELMHRDVAAADTMVQRFADLLRFSLDSERRAEVPLEEEIRIVTGYLEIEQMRLGSRLRWEVRIDPECNPLTVPSLVVLTLVENSLKHAVAPRRTGGSVRVAGFLKSGELKLLVKDDGPGFSEKDIMPGHGLDLLLRRLASWNCGGRISIIRDEPGVTVGISIPSQHAGTTGANAALVMETGGLPA